MHPARLSLSTPERLTRIHYDDPAELNHERFSLGMGVPDQLDKVSLSFLVDDLEIRRGGVAANIAFGMARLGLHPVLIGSGRCRRRYYHYAR